MEYLISYKNISIQDGVKPSFNMCNNNHVHGGDYMLQITGVNLYLESIKYSVEQVSTENENVHVSRLLEIVDCTETKISVRLRKELKSENLNVPFLDISSIGEFYLSDKAMQNFDSIRDMEDYVENRLDFLVDKVQMDTYLSQLIANVTGSFGNTLL